MKTAKYLAIAVGFVAVLLALGWFLRNTIIQRISNPILGQYDVTVTDVSLDALATSDASISYLELEHVNGTTIAIDDLTLPIGTSASGFKSFTAEKVTIELPAGEDAEPPGLARILNQLLALPLQLPNTEHRTQHITLPYDPRAAMAVSGEQSATDSARRSDVANDKNHPH
jgi:hypothetical protein